MPADEPSNNNSLLINDQDLIDQEDREDVYAQGHRRINNLNRLISKFNDKQTILRLLREKQLSQVDPNTLATIAQTEDPFALAEFKQSVLANISEYDLLNAKLGLLNDIQESLKYLKDLQQIRRRRGIVISNTVVFQVEDQTTQLDLETNTMVNVPATQFIRLPRQKAYKIWVKNRSGGTINIGLPREFNDTITDITILAADPAFELETDDPTIQFLNIRAITNDATAEIRFFI